MSAATLYRKIRTRYYTKRLREAYLNKDSRILKRLRKQARQLYGIEKATQRAVERVRRKRDPFHWEAQNRLFNEGLKVDFGPCEVGFENLKVNADSGSCLYTNLYLDGFYDELASFHLYKTIVTAGTIAIDVGANVGVHSLAFASLVGPTGRVEAFEPRCSLIPGLQQNLALNGVQERVRIHNLGIGLKAERVPFNEDSSNFNQGTGRRDLASNDFLQVQPLDSFKDIVNSEKHVSMIKIDVEGMELDVLAGATELMRKQAPHLVIEHNTPPWTLRDLVATIPYPVEVFKIPNSFHEKMRPVDIRSPNLYGFNNLFITRR